MQLKSLALGKKTASRLKATPQTMAIRLTSISTEKDQPGMFHGVNVETNELVKVRMTNVAEGAALNQRANETLEAANDRIRTNYVGSGQKRRPKPSEFADPANKVHCKVGGVVLFTKVLQNDDGTYRAHWAETLESEPGVSVKKQLTHIAIGHVVDPKDASKKISSYVAANVIHPEKAVILDKDNVDGTMIDAFQNKDENGQRSPFVLARFIEVATGKIFNDLPEIQLNAVMVESEVRDFENDVTTKVRRPGTAEQTLAFVANPEVVYRDVLFMRAAMHGAGGKEGYPDFGAVPDDAKADLREMTDAVRSGEYHVEIIPGETLLAGPMSKESMLKSFDTVPNHPLTQQRGTQWLENGDGERVERKNLRMYKPAYITVKQGEADYRYFIKAQPAEAYAKGFTLYNVATVNDKVANAEASVVRTAEAAVEVVEGDESDFNPEQLLGVEAGIDAKLAESSESLAM